MDDAVFWDDEIVKGRHYLVRRGGHVNEWLGFYDGTNIHVRHGGWPASKRVCKCTLPFEDAQDFIKTTILAQHKELASRIFVASHQDPRFTTEGE